MNARSRLSSTAALVAAMALGGAASAAAGPRHDARRIAVAVDDYVGIDPATLAAAERIAGDVYLRAGIEIDWVEPGTFEDPAWFSVNLLSNQAAESPFISHEAVGFATPGTRAANAIYDRIRELAHYHHLPCAVMLGYVMAHELGHLLLPANSHSDSGLMRASLDMELAAEKKLRFTSDQAALMLERLTAPPVVSTH
jgi:hypothetical protein